MLIMIMTGLGSYAQKTVTFTAGTDCGKNSSYKRLSNVSEEISKDGVTLKASNATFNAGATYSAKKNIYCPCCLPMPTTPLHCLLTASTRPQPHGQARPTR